MELQKLTAESMQALLDAPKKKQLGIHSGRVFDSHFLKRVYPFHLIVEYQKQAGVMPLSGIDFSFDELLRSFKRASFHRKFCLYFNPSNLGASTGVKFSKKKD